MPSMSSDIQKELNIDELKDQSLKYQKVVDKAQSPTVTGLELMSELQTGLSSAVKSIIVTNFNLRGRQKTAYYVLKLSQRVIEMLEINDNVKNNIVYTFSSEKITLNTRPMSALYRKVFADRLKEVTRDIQQERAVVLEERKSK